MSYIPKEIPQDMCKELWGCEKNQKDCPYFKEYLAGTPVAPSTEGVTDEKERQAQLKQLRQAAVCVEKMQNAKAMAKGQGQSNMQRAAFLMSTLWSPGEKLKISFMPLPENYPGMQPQWDGSTIRPQTTRVPTSSGTDGGTSCSNDDECSKNTPGTVCVNGKCIEDIMPVWYTRDQVMTNMNPSAKITPEDEELEKKVRAMDPADAIKYVINERIQPLIGVKFEWVEAEGDIRIKLDNRGGAWSYVGNQSKSIPMEQETMNFGWLDVATIIHEFCHALGMIHEHQNPYGKGIDWNLKKVYSWATATQGWDMYTTCENITKKYATDQVNGSNYDPKSIMLYSYPGWLTNNNQATYRNVSLSDYDKEWLSAIYPKSGSRRIPDRQAQSGSGSSSSSSDWILYGLMGLVVVGAIGYLIYRKRKSKTKSLSM